VTDGQTVHDGILYRWRTIAVLAGVAVVMSAGPAPTSVMLTLPPFAAADSHTSAVAIPVSVSLIILVIIVGLVLLYLCR